LHLAYQAKRSRNPAAEESFLQSVLQVNLTSAVAHADLGQLWKNRGDCVKARAEFEQASSVLLRGGDQGLNVSQLAQREWALALQGAAASCQ
jgi:hypothetical protein